MQDSNLRSRGYEPREIPLLQSAIRRFCFLPLAAKKEEIVVLDVKMSDTCHAYHLFFLVQVLYRDYSSDYRDTVS